jgi:hypothetical protein
VQENWLGGAQNVECGAGDGDGARRQLRVTRSSILDPVSLAKTPRRVLLYCIAGSPLRSQHPAIYLVEYLSIRICFMHRTISSGVDSTSAA